MPSPVNKCHERPQGQIQRVERTRIPVAILSAKLKVAIELSIRMLHQPRWGLFGLGEVVQLRVRSVSGNLIDRPATVRPAPGRRAIQVSVSAQGQPASRRPPVTRTTVKKVENRD